MLLYICKNVHMFKYKYKTLKDYILLTSMKNKLLRNNQEFLITSLFV